MQLKTNIYKVSSDKIPESFNGFRIVFLTDLHNCRYGKNNKILLKRIMELSPDIVLIGGDMVVGTPQFHKIKRLAWFYSVLAKHFPVFYSYGNHERRLSFYEKTYGTRFSDYLNMMKKRGIKILDNKSLYLIKDKTGFIISDGNLEGSASLREKSGDFTDRIRISGLNSDLDFYGKFWKSRHMKHDYIEEVLGQAAQDYDILLAHHPKYFKEYEKWGADLILAGHLHGGMIRLPFIGGVFSPDFTLFPRYSAGKYSGKKALMIVSKGLGEHTLPFRIFDKRELSLIVLGHGKH